MTLSDAEMLVTVTTAGIVTGAITPKLSLRMKIPMRFTDILRRHNTTWRYSCQAMTSSHKNSTISKYECDLNLIGGSCQI